MGLKGRWRIVEMALWDEDAIDLVGPAFIELRDDDQGSFRFIAVEGWMDVREAERESSPWAQRSRPATGPSSSTHWRPMTKTATAHDRIADTALAALTAVRPSNDAVGAAVAAAALLAERAAQEISDRDRVIRIAKREGATLERSPTQLVSAVRRSPTSALRAHQRSGLARAAAASCAQSTTPALTTHCTR